MFSRRTFATLVLTLLTAWAASPPAAFGQSVRLGVDGSKFTLNGQPVFLLGVSYYGALGAPRPFILQDLDQMKQLGFNWIRVWATWSAFDNDVSAVDQNGDPRPPYFDKLKWLLEQCDRRGIVVDITLTRGEGRLGHAHLSATDVRAKALQTLATRLKQWRNWYVDVANEHNLRRKFVSLEDARLLRDRVKQVDPDRLVTISFVHDLPDKDIRRYVSVAKVDFLTPHRPRNRRSPQQTESVTRQYLQWTAQAGRLIPVHYQEPFRRDFTKGWQPSVEDFVTDLRGAIRGGAAGWCFHNGDNRFAPNGEPRRSFDMRQKRLFDQLDSVERQVVRGLAQVVRDELSQER